MKLNFRKIASVLTSTVMLSSTLALAAAANYPAPFVSGGNADVAVVYGSSAALSDVVAVTDITQDLQARLASQTATSGTSTSGTSVSGGDFVKLSKTSDNINLGNDVYDVFGTKVTDDNLKDLLVSGIYTNDENSDYDYDQTIELVNNNLVLNYFKNSDYNEDKPSIGINLSSGLVILNYSLDFIDEPQSDVSSSDLLDFETTTLNILGKEYYISDADNISVTGTGTLTLLDTANAALVAEGETKSVTVGDKSYDVSISFISTSEVKLNINGEETNSLSEGSTFKLNDGTYVGIKDILARDVQGVAGKVEFSLGSGKLELRGGQSIRINDGIIEEITTEFKDGSSGSGGKESLDRINLVWTTIDNEFITPEQEIVMPGFGNLKLSMGTFVGTANEVTSIKAGSSSYLQLETTLNDGAVTIPFLYSNGDGDISGIGKDSSNKLFTTNETDNANIIVFNYSGGDRYFVGSYNTSTDSESYYLKFHEFSKNDAGVNTSDVSKLEDGVWKVVCEDRKAGDTCNMGSLSLTISRVQSNVDPGRLVNFTINGGATLNTLFTKEGLDIALPYFGSNYTTAALSPDGLLNLSASQTGHNSTSFSIFMTTEDRNDGLAKGTKFHVNTTSNADNQIENGNYYTGREIFSNPDESTHQLSMVYSEAAALVERTGESSDQRDVKVTYYGGDSFSDVILSTKGATVTGGTTTTGDGNVKVLGSVSVSDSEASSVSSKNLIVVGGSCVNSVAASLLGGSLCGADFSTKTGVNSGQFLIQTFDRGNNKVATLVAGYNAGDTTNAAKFLTTKTVDTMAGKKYKGTSATQADLQVS